MKTIEEGERLPDELCRNESELSIAGLNDLIPADISITQFWLFIHDIKTQLKSKNNGIILTWVVHEFMLSYSVIHVI